MTKFERMCWRVTLELLIQIALLTLAIGRKQGVIYCMHDELRYARQLARELEATGG